ncbi:hypothetical protein DFJ73DRAFT_775482 [Zopfochytrium polystomum]|nr:hypothetical protein DFJ73DRAFT_775482 [Zopfochytrium polystomum]
MRIVSPFLLPKARRQAVEALRKTVLAATPSSPAAATSPDGKPPAAPLLSPDNRLLHAPSIAPKLRNHFFPDVNVHQLAMQDPSLRTIGLKGNSHSNRFIQSKRVGGVGKDIV